MCVLVVPHPPCSYSQHPPPTLLHTPSICPYPPFASIVHLPISSICPYPPFAPPSKKFLDKIPAQDLAQLAQDLAPSAKIMQAKFWPRSWPRSYSRYDSWLARSWPPDKILAILLRSGKNLAQELFAGPTLHLPLPSICPYPPFAPTRTLSSLWPLPSSGLPRFLPYL